MKKIKTKIITQKNIFLIIILIINLLYCCVLSAQELKNKNSSIIISNSKKNHWRVLPIRSKEEYDQGLIGGEAEQHLHGIARSISNPDIIYLSHDVSGAWRSIDSGATWQKTLDKGLYANKGQSIEVDPVNPKIVFLETDNAWNWLAKNYKGLYKSTDGGDSWKLVLHTETNYNPNIHRIYRHNIAYDPASKNKNGAMRWYAAFPENGLFRSEDGGISWTKNPVSSLKGHSIIYSVQTHPNDGRTLYLASSKGLFISSSRGANLKKCDFPEGEASSIAINPKNPLIIYITLKDRGLYRTLDGAKTFSLIKEFDAVRVFINYGYPDIIYLVGTSSNTIISHDEGKTWNYDIKTIPAPGLGRKGKWKSRIAGELTGIAPNPKNPKEAVAYSRATIWKTTDGGKIFKDSSTLFTGFAWSWSNSGAAFDLFDRQRYAFFNCDVGMTITYNEGKYFEQRNNGIWNWFNKKIITWIGTYSGDFQPVKNSKVIVASVGGYFRTQLMRSENEGKTWKLINDLEENANFFVAFNKKNPDIVYAGNKISNDTGQSFSKIDFGKYNKINPSVFGMCNSQPNTVYAMDSKREYILRSDDACNTWRMYTHPGWKFAKLDSRPTFAVDPKDPDKIYSIDKDGDLAVFERKKWKSSGILKLAGGSELGNFVRTITVDPNYPEIIYAGMSASGISCIWRSMNGGRSWEDITYNLPRTGVSAISVNPHTGELFIGSAVGTLIFPAPSRK